MSSDAQSVTGILRVSAKHKIVKQYFLLEQLNNVGPWCCQQQSVGLNPGPDNYDLPEYEGR